MQKFGLACTVLLLLAGTVNADVPALTDIAILRSADWLESPLIGYSGTPSRFVAAYGHIVAQPDAATTFRTLLWEATPAGKIYALAGLYDVDRAEFEGLVDTIKRLSPPEFTMMDGCLVSGVSREELFAQLSTGKLSARWRPAGWKPPVTSDKKAS